MMHASWAWASASPYKGTKLVAAYFGGTRQPLAVRWPKGIKHDATPRPQFSHVNDIVPTIYDVIGIKAPKIVNGTEQMPFDGVSMKYSFNDPKATGQHHTQYFEIMTSRALYKDGWLACTFGLRAPWVQGLPDFKNWDPMKEKWELYHIDEDWSEANDLAAKYPDKLEMMKSEFLVQAAKNNVLPIGGTFWSTAIMHPEDAPHSALTKWHFSSLITQIQESNLGPRFASKSNQMDFDLTVPKKANGVLVAVGGFGGGVSLFIKNGYVNYEYNLFLMNRTKIAAKSKLPEGNVKLEVTSKLQGGPGSPMDVTIKANGKVIAQGTVPRSIPSFIALNDGFDIGQDLGSPVSEAYYDQAPFEFNGKINGVDIEYTK
ncbi:MAG: hypothetical protein ACK5JS_09770 [Mangrovibacterium sp.]